MPGEDVTAPEAAEETIPQEGAEEEILEGGGEEETAVEDPGQLEGTGNVVKDSGPPEGSKRWNDVYFKAKEGERQVGTLTAENDALKKQLEEFSTKVPVEPVAPAAPQYVAPVAPAPDKLVELKDSLTNLRTERAQAAADFDNTKIVELESKIDDIKDEIADIKWDKKQAANSAAVTDAVRQAEVSKAAASFATKNPWLSTHTPAGTANPHYDPIMSGAAMALEKDLSTNWTGSYPEMLDEIDKRITERFNPAQGPPAAVKPKMAVVQGGRAVRQVASSDNTELTESEKNAAHGMFGSFPNPEEAYKKAKIDMKKGVI